MPRTDDGFLEQAVSATGLPQHGNFSSSPLWEKENELGGRPGGR